MSTRLNDPRLPTRFWNKIAISDSTGCWLWTASKRRDGYGQFSFGGRPRSAHRVAYETLIGPVPHDMELDHLCRERECCNPGHLEPVTRQVNVSRGLQGSLHIACPRGHEFTTANTAFNNRGHRFCRTCSRARYQQVAPENDERKRPRELCKRGHVLAGTARVSKGGDRRCGECANQLQRKRRARERADMGA